MSITTAWRLSHISKIVIISKHFSSISLSNLVGGSQADVDTSSPCYAVVAPPCIIKIRACNYQNHICIVIRLVMARYAELPSHIQD